MLRRQPTTIKLTPEDVLHYDDEKVKNPPFGVGANQNERLGQFPPKSKDERLGIKKSVR
jgi:hypothetical protein